MKRRLSLLSFLLLVALGCAWQGFAQNESTPASDQITRPRYNLNLNLDYQLLTFNASGQISVPMRPGDSVRDVVFFIYANAPGVSGNDGTHNNIAVDEVTLNKQKLEYSLKGAVLRVQLPQVQSTPFTLGIKWRGVVPRAPAGSGGLMDMMGGMDIGGLLGGAAAPKKDPDYGVYSYGNGVLSLGSFWYPSLAVRQNGKWIDEAPGGVGDVGFSEASDFGLRITANRMLQVAATGQRPRLMFEVVAKPTVLDFQAHGTRDFAILASDQFVTKSKQIEIAGKPITVSAYVTKAHEAKVDKALDIAVHSLQIFSEKFGSYPYDEFKVVEGPMRGGAGGMEFSGLVSIASFLFDDMDKQMNELAAGLGVGNLDKMLGDLGLGDEGGAAVQNANENPAQDLLGGMIGQQKAMFDSMLEMTIAHEVAHQWWAMGVGSDAQREPWIDESLTNYSAIVYFEERYGKAKAEEMMETHLRTAYSTGRMLGGADAPVNRSTSQYTNSMQYGAIVYGKGALFYDALRKLVGDEAFFKSLREYYSSYSGKLASSDSLPDIVKFNAPQKRNEIQNLYLRWIASTHGDEDIAGGKVTGVEDLLGGLLGGMMSGLGE